MESVVEVRLDNLFFKSFTADSDRGCPIYVFDSTYLPSADEVESREVYDLLIDEMMNKLVAKLPDSAFSLVVFSSGFSQNNVSWIYGVKVYSKIPKTTRAKLQNLYIVHESFFVRAVYLVLTNALNINPFKNKQLSSDGLLMHHVSSLADLSRLVDITRLRISLNVYLYEYQLNETFAIPDPHLEIRSALANRQYRQLVFDKIFKRLRIEAPRHELIFQKPGSYQKVNILLGIIERNNYVDLSQWDIYSLATLFLHFIKGKSKPILPIDLIPLPINESFDYTYNTFVNMMMNNGYYDLTTFVFELFLSILDSSKTTLHDYRSLSKCLTPTLCKEKVSIKTSDRLAIGYRYTTNILIHFRDLKTKIASTGALTGIAAKSLDGSSTPRLMKDGPKVPPPRKSSPTRSALPNLNSPANNKISPAKPPALPRRKVQDKFTNSQQTPPILLPPGPSSSAVSVEIGNIMQSPYARSDSSGQSEESLYTDSPVPELRISSNSSVVLDNPAKIDETQYISDDAVTFKSKPTDNTFKIDERMTNLLLDNNQKIRKFDKELKKKKLATNSDSSNSSSTGFSDIKAENKVSRLAALYEERLIGIRVMEDMRRNQ
ncbi:LANO_0G03290g1_1 [Lachancea nothofagi CBS 11611]|uniref:LANO_0G03290g1_1 n=1 Tax=Lachancea nothofagi CBS 11611 TaxID=1266666 RepID=A0A1G4KFT8_9SACH|nr:LANO_0G03290g1_1 [Lachancea nothofagi CBS 11611]